MHTLQNKKCNKGNEIITFEREAYCRYTRLLVWDMLHVLLMMALGCGQW